MAGHVGPGGGRGGAPGHVSLGSYFQKETIFSTKKQTQLFLDYERCNVVHVKKGLSNVLMELSLFHTLSFNINPIDNNSHCQVTIDDPFLYLQ